MKTLAKRGLWAGMLTVGVAAVAAVALTGSASAERAQAAKTVTLKMDLRGQKLEFFGPKSVGAGDKLEIVNRTAVEKVGPHTFTLIKPRLMDTKKERQKCARFQGKVCPRILEAHEVGPPPDFPVGRPNLDFGKNGWDREFARTRNGDSWFTDELGDSETRKVTARAGDTLGYFCLVHPNMRGKLEVE